MNPEGHTYQINPKNLTIYRDEIYRAMGYKTFPGEQIINGVEELLVESYKVMKIQTGYSFIHKKRLTIRDHAFFLDNEKFDCGKIIYSQLKGSEEMVVFLATLGNRFDDFSKTYFDSGDPYKGYLVDTIGSVVVETAIDRMCDELSRQLNKQGKRCTNRFSPGYCNWDIAEQQKLFNYLPQKFLGVELLPSSLMKPIKSVSGIIGIGPNVKKMPYTCSLCEQENCIMRKHQSTKKEEI